MRNKLIITSFAEADLYDIKSWYSSAEIDLFLQFVSEFDTLVNLILINPLAFPKVTKKYRKAILKTFPYKIIYNSTDNVVRIIAVIHHKRNPKIWKSRKI